MIRRMTRPMRISKVAILSALLAATADAGHEVPGPSDRASSGIGESQVTILLRGPQSSRFQATVIAKRGRVLVAVTAAHCLAAAEAGKPVLHSPRGIRPARSDRQGLPEPGLSGTSLPPAHGHRQRHRLPPRRRRMARARPVSWRESGPWAWPRARSPPPTGRGWSSASPINMGKSTSSRPATSRIPRCSPGGRSSIPSGAIRGPGCSSSARSRARSPRRSSSASSSGPTIAEGGPP